MNKTSVVTHKNYPYALSVNPTKWSNTLKQFVGNSRRIVLSVFDHFEGLALKGLYYLDGV